MEHYSEVDTGDSVAPFISDPPQTSHGACSTIHIRPPVRFGVRPQLSSTECDRQNLLLTLIVVLTTSVVWRREASQFLDIIVV